MQRPPVGYKTVATCSNRFKLGDHNIEVFHDTHKQNQAYLWNISVIFRLLKSWEVFGGSNANNVQLF